MLNYCISQKKYLCIARTGCLLSVEEKRSTIDSLKDREKIKRVKGRERIEMLASFVQDLIFDIDSAMVGTSSDLYKSILSDMSSNKDKASRSK